MGGLETAGPPPIRPRRPRKKKRGFCSFLFGGGGSDSDEGSNFDFEDSDVESDWEDEVSEDESVVEPMVDVTPPRTPIKEPIPVAALPEDDELLSDEYECTRCVLIGRDPVGVNDGGACCRQCFAEATPDFFATTYHANGEHHACGPDFPESEAELYARAGHAADIPRLRAEWRHAHAEWHAANPTSRLSCPLGDHALCRPEYGLGCTEEEIEALGQVVQHNADVHDTCPEDYPTLMMRRPDGIAFTVSETAFALALWRHSHLRHELCGPYIQNSYPEFDCSAGEAAAHAEEWAQICEDRAAGRPTVDNVLSLTVPAMREAAAERARVAAESGAQWSAEDLMASDDDEHGHHGHGLHGHGPHAHGYEPSHGHSHSYSAAATTEADGASAHAQRRPESASPVPDTAAASTGACDSDGAGAGDFDNSVSSVPSVAEAASEAAREGKAPGSITPPETGDERTAAAVVAVAAPSLGAL